MQSLRLQNLLAWRSFHAEPKVQCHMQRIIHSRQHISSISFKNKIIVSYISSYSSSKHLSFINFSLQKKSQGNGTQKSKYKQVNCCTTQVLWNIDTDTDTRHDTDTDTWTSVKHIKFNSDMDIGVVLDTKHDKKLECPCFITQVLKIKFVKYQQ